MEDLRQRDIALFAISYDSVETLSGFAAKHGITYSLLADEGSRVIKQLDMLDNDLDRHHAEFGRTVRDDQRGVAYPGVLLLDRDGIVTQRRVHRNYRIRDTGTGLLEAVLGIDAPAQELGAVMQGGPVQVRAYLDSPTYRPYQRLHLCVELATRDGWHLYTAPVPEGYVGVTAEIEPVEGLQVDPPAWPPGRPFHVSELDEVFSVLDGRIRARIPLTPAVGMGRGELLIKVMVGYQACGETVCLPPTYLHMVFRIREAPFAE